MIQFFENATFWKRNQRTEIEGRWSACHIKSENNSYQNNEMLQNGIHDNKQRNILPINDSRTKSNQRNPVWSFNLI